MKNLVKEVLFRSILRRLIHLNQFLRVDQIRHCKGGLDLLLLNLHHKSTSFSGETKIILADREIGVVYCLSTKDKISL